MLQFNDGHHEVTNSTSTIRYISQDLSSPTIVNSDDDYDYNMFFDFFERSHEEGFHFDFDGGGAVSIECTDNVGMDPGNSSRGLPIKMSPSSSATEVGEDLHASNSAGLPDTAPRGLSAPSPKSPRVPNTLSASRRNVTELDVGALSPSNSETKGVVWTLEGDVGISVISVKAALVLGLAALIDDDIGDAG